MTANQINWFKAQTERDHYKVVDPELIRHNFSTESIQREQNAIQNWFNQQQAAHLNRQDAINDAHYIRMDSEAGRHNVAEESLSNTKNIISARELTVREQLGNEELDIKRDTNDISRGKLANDTARVSNERRQTDANVQNLQSQVRSRDQILPFEKFRIVTGGIGDITKSIGNLSKSTGDVVRMIPQIMKIIK